MSQGVPIESPHAVTIDKLMTQLGASSEGLSTQEAQVRLSTYGPNEIKEKRSFSVISLLISQFTSFLVLLLIGAGIFSYVIGEHIDAIAILAIVVINGILGFIQEFKAEQSLASLKQIEVMQARVLRDGKESIILASEIVPGDIVILEEGKKIIADARIIEAYALMADESLLTGESVPVSKRAAELETNTALADRTNMLFSGSLITMGHGKALVVHTGETTELGKIAHDLQSATKEETPLQQAMQKLGRTLAIICIIVVIPGLFIGIYTKQPVTEMIILAVSLAVSAIPEGLPIVVTISLAIGIRRMAKQNVLVRKLSSAETLGGTDVICTDKTGTITHNQMTVLKALVMEKGIFNISGEGYSTEGSISYDDAASAGVSMYTKEPSNDELRTLLMHSVLCNDATVDLGDPTERALIVAGVKAGIATKKVRDAYARVDEIPFNSDQKYMAVHVQQDSKHIAIIKGAPEVIFSMSHLPEGHKDTLTRINDTWTSEGLRVLAVASTDMTDGSLNEQSYILQGLIAMYDPPRQEVTQALTKATEAGVRVIMVTGDHHKTAAAIAQQIGLVSERVVTGVEIDAMDDTAFTNAIEHVNIFARVSPQHKLRILESLQKKGHLVAMTGDGVNDAPAIKKANIGIAAGSGTDLSKEVADMVLLDDNFASIVKGIEEGRRIFYNIKKVIRYLVSANFYGIALVFASILLGMPIPLLPLQILWINLVTDALPALALSSDVADPENMKQKPYNPTKEITTRTTGYAAYVGLVGFVIMMGLYILLSNKWQIPLEETRTVVFTASVVFELMLVFVIRSRKNLSLAQLTSNKTLWAGVLTGLIGQLFVIYHSFGHMVFNTVPLTLADWGIIILFTSGAILLIELLKWLDNHVPALEKYIPSA